MAFEAAIIVSLLLGAVAWRAPWVLMKPSIQLVAAANLLLQWPMALWSERIFAGIPDPSAIVIGVALPLLVTLGWAPFVGERRVRAFASTLALARADSSGRDGRTALVALWIMAGIAVMWYLSVVPLRSTGLYVLFTHPAAAALAREDSLKLLSNRLLVYVHLNMAMALCPLIGGLSVRLGALSVHRRRWATSCLYYGSALAAVLAASLSGARSLPARVVLAIALTVWLESGMRIRVFRMAALGVAALGIVAYLSIRREGKSADVELLASYVAGGVLDRAVIVPAEVGVWHIRYADSYGLFGASAIPKLAYVMGVHPVNAANVVGRHYAPDALASMSANASFLLTYLSYFGGAGVLANCVALGLLECLVLVLGRMSASMLGPCIATLAVANVSFLSADFTTVLLSHGVLLVAFLGWALSAWTAGARGAGNASALPPTA